MDDSYYCLIVRPLCFDWIEFATPKSAFEKFLSEGQIAFDLVVVIVVFLIVFVLILLAFFHGIE